MLVRVLGEVSLLAPDGSSIPLPGSRQPALLAALAARPGQLVSASRLVHLLWGDASPENPSAALHSAVFKLRANLAKTSGRDLLVTREGGYLLDLAPADLDAAEFDRLMDSARDLPAAEAAAELGRALDLWRGTAYGTFADTEIAQLEALRLEELRRTAVERKGLALLAANRAGEAVSLLQPFVSEHPLRETARICLMRALHADGRTAGARALPETSLAPGRRAGARALACTRTGAGRPAPHSASWPRSCCGSRPAAGGDAGNAGAVPAHAERKHHRLRHHRSGPRWWCSWAGSPALTSSSRRAIHGRRCSRG